LESNLADHTSTSLSASGVRKYDYMTGWSEVEIPTCRERFTSIDPLWLGQPHHRKIN